MIAYFHSEIWHLFVATIPQEIWQMKGSWNKDDTSDTCQNVDVVLFPSSINIYVVRICILTPT